MNIFRATSRNPLFLLVLCLILLATCPLYLPPYLIILLISIYMYIVLAVSWTSFCGPSGYFQLATAAFLGIGVYVPAMLIKVLPLSILIPLGGVLAFLLALLTGMVCLRLRGMYFSIFTFGLSELFRHSITWYEVNVVGTVGRWVPSANHTTVYYYMLATTAIVLLVTYVFRRSRFGLALKSMGLSEEAAAHSGVNVTAVKIVTFAFSAFFMGATGAIMANRWTWIEPDIAFNPFLTFFPIVMALLGGIKSFYGPILGASLMVVISDRLISMFPYYTALSYGIILVVLIMFLPEGLAGLIQGKVERSASIKKVDI